MKEAILYKKLNNRKVQCRVCNHYCKINPGKRGVCGVRENKNGKLYSLVYDRACAENIDPIEKKPFYHFLPGTFSLSIATVGCNFRCHNCQNWDISQNVKIAADIIGQELPPEKIVQNAIDNNCPSISYTYTEPTIFLEYALDTMKLARKAGLKNCWVSNGYMSKESLKLIFPNLDAINVDLKSSDDEFYKKYCNARLQPVLDNLMAIKKAKVHLEVTTLVIPTLNDEENNLKKIAQFIHGKLGADTPWHVSRFSGMISWKLQHLPDTPAETIRRAKEIGEGVGLKRVHLGNI
ncbi:AmmeMemoRadiSam system radical SAM enzyme [Patescibacteria group bacterium]|nr:AmmeMemoRadiSam system radical SAM enzyme [Patescibacteria group bacterium]MBU4512969.1 AmmeMemoRadiSam system radical SAM enzyme [Patescibacteria group bacterium]MCG2693005.1 AmmeMemoRadiSam system radical SAM enzyme [Candidatus Parcubacteria bacterium]